MRTKNPFMVKYKLVSKKLGIKEIIKSSKRLFHNKESTQETFSTAEKFSKRVAQKETPPDHS